MGIYSFEMEDGKQYLKQQHEMIFEWITLIFLKIQTA